MSVLRPLKHPRNTSNHSATKVESESKTKHLSLALKSQDAAVNSEDDFKQSKAKKRRFAVSLPEEVEALKKTTGSVKHEQIDNVGSA